ncbi:hypothetical protein ANCCAN_21050 [Ancylostoma caninum]|uniref:Uncharacterized protein n=1 Tax=Ancylostoma caninum TaxID=29170 RepID=A0A368FLL1_ANCCA|nr:hypothetical protein ANCCAN_21050 [Ancylostoma caninum]
MIISFSMAFPLLFATTTSLECYLGYSVLKGSTIGSNTKKCEKDTDFCYNATAEVATFSTIQKAGCNTLICQFNPDKCFERNVTGIPVKFCCCRDEDLCNRGEMTVRYCLELPLGW